VLHYGDLTDSTNHIRIVQQVCSPMRSTNLGAQSHVAVEFESPNTPANGDALGTLRILEAVRILPHVEKHGDLSGPAPASFMALVQRDPQKEDHPLLSP